MRSLSPCNHWRLGRESSSLSWVVPERGVEDRKHQVLRLTSMTTALAALVSAQDTHRVYSFAVRDQQR